MTRPSSLIFRHTQILGNLSALHCTPVQYKTDATYPGEDFGARLVRDDVVFPVGLSEAGQQPREDLDGHAGAFLLDFGGTELGECATQGEELVEARDVVDVFPIGSAGDHCEIQAEARSMLTVLACARPSVQL